MNRFEAANGKATYDTRDRAIEAEITTPLGIDGDTDVYAEYDIEALANEIIIMGQDDTIIP